MNILASRGAVLVFTLLYIAGGGVFLISTGNTEFVAYIAILLAVVAVFVWYRKRIVLPTWLLWMLSLVGLLHLMGGGVLIDRVKLYEVVLLPLSGSGELTLFKFDQLVHAYSTGVGALLVFAFLRRARGLRIPSLFLITFFAALGIGAVNEIIEFAVKLSVPDNGVGGYYNNALDLVFNALGAGLATTAALEWWREEV